MPQIIVRNKEDNISKENMPVLIDSNRPAPTDEEFQTLFIGQHETPPESAEENQLYFDSDGVMYEYVNNEWSAITQIQEMDIVEPNQDLVLYLFSDDHEIIIKENETLINDPDGNPELIIDDVDSSNGILYNVDSYPDETFQAHKYRYNPEDGFTGPLDTWVDPS